MSNCSGGLYSPVLLFPGVRPPGPGGRSKGSKRTPKEVYPGGLSGGWRSRTHSGSSWTPSTQHQTGDAGIEIASTALRRILTGADLKSPRRGCLYRWAAAINSEPEGHGSRFALLLAVDNATGVVVNAPFSKQVNVAKGRSTS